VAAQQGEYLAKCFNRKELCEKNPEGPLRFRASGRHQFHPFRYSIFSHHFSFFSFFICYELLIVWNLSIV
jgi:hypothetical protein